MNAALNYGYGILYNEVERALLFAGLDPFVGMLHSERYGKPSLTLDFVEEFRVPVVDSAVLSLFANERFNPRDFVRAENKTTLSPYGKKKIVRAVFTQLNMTTEWKGSEHKLSTVITEQGEVLARSLLQSSSMYESFVAPAVFYEKSLIPDRCVVEVPHA